MLIDVVTNLAEEDLAAGEREFKYAQIMRWLNYGQDKLRLWVAQKNFNHPIRSDSIVTSSGTNEYDLPEGYRKAMLLKDSNGVEIPFVITRKQFNYNINTSIAQARGNYAQRAYIYDRTIGFAPNITTAKTYTLLHQFRPAGLHFSTAPSQSGLTTVQFKLDDPDAAEPSRRVGKISIRDDYYNGMYIEIYDGTGQGQLRKISDYAGSTRICTVLAWTTAPDETSLYALVSPFFEELHEAIVLWATIRGCSKDNTRRELFKTDLNDLLDLFAQSIKDRQTQNPQYLDYKDPEYEI